MLDAGTDTRIDRLSRALADLAQPMVRLFEYADTLEALVQANERIQATCVAAAIRAEAERVQGELARALGAVREAAGEVIGG
ncbi:MAG TPA: hypothetical protein VFE17_02480 [Candidatus Baltobacteraceae bacterium]|jgi:hypothetical protein|nr:hypothetical protein [Candidatus Baltobacteraceae bacterium]